MASLPDMLRDDCEATVSMIQIYSNTILGFLQDAAPTGTDKSKDQNHKSQEGGPYSIASNGWNHFQKEHKGRGIPKTELLLQWKNLTPDIKATYAGPKTSKRKIYIRCCPGSFSKLVNRYGLDSKDPLLDGSPFKGLFRFTKYNLNRKLVTNIASTFDLAEKTVMVDGKKHILKVEDFIEILQLNNEIGVTEISELSDVLITKFCTDKGKNKHKFVTKSKIEKVLADKQNKEDVQRAFALAALELILFAPASGGRLGHTELRMVADVEKMKAIPWANLAMDWLLKGIRTYQNGKKKDKGGELNLGGCMIVLELFYLMKRTGKKLEHLLEKHLLENELLESCESADKTSIRIINEQGMKLRSMTNHQNELLEEIGWKHINQNKNQKAKESIGTLTTLGTEITKACCQLVLEFSQSAITQSCNQKAVEFYQSAQNWVGQLMLVNKNVFGLLGESDDNEAEDMIMAGPFHVRATLDLDADDSRLLNWIFHSHEKDGDKCVAQIPTDTFPIKKRDMQCLLPEAWLSSFTINYVVEKLCFQENMKKNLERWYFYLGSAVDLEKKRLMKIRADRSQLDSVKQFFFPIGHMSHFFLIVVDTQTRNMEVWDTAKKRKDIESYMDHLDNVCQTLNQIMQRDEFFSYKRILTDVPQQTNSYDCGVFVCYYLEHPQNVQKFHKKKWISEEQRFRLCLRILNTRHNIKRDLIYQDAELWSKQNVSSRTINLTPGFDKSPNPDDHPYADDATLRSVLRSIKRRRLSEKQKKDTHDEDNVENSNTLFFFVQEIRNAAVGSASRIPKIRNECDTEKGNENEDSWVKISLQDDTKAAEILLLLKEQATNVVKDPVGSSSRELEMYL